MLLLFTTLIFSAPHFRCDLPFRTSYYLLMNQNGDFYYSKSPGTVGGYWQGSTRIYGRLDCPSALRWITRGHYIKYRVFFANEQDAISAGFRPCKICMKERYKKHEHG